MRLQPVILAAGKGTRLKSDLPKALFPIDGKPMIRWVIEALAGVPECLPPIIVVGHGAEHIRGELGAHHTYAEQKELSGTATAVRAATPHLSPDVPTLVLFGDNPFVTSESIDRIRRHFIERHPTLAMFSTTVSDFDEWRAPFAAFGRVVRDAHGTVQRLVEFKNTTADERVLREVAPGGHCFDTRWLLDALPKIKPNPVTGEYYLTDLVEMATVGDGDVITVDLPEHEALGINSIEDAHNAKRRIG